MGHKANDTALLCSILYICHFYFYRLCSSYLSMHELSQIEPAIEMEIILVFRWLKGNNFLLLEARLSWLLFLWESYGCVALLTRVFNINNEFRGYVLWRYKSESAHNRDSKIGKWVWSWRHYTEGLKFFSYNILSLVLEIGFGIHMSIM